MANFEKTNKETFNEDMLNVIKKMREGNSLSSEIHEDLIDILLKYKDFIKTDEAEEAISNMVEKIKEKNSNEFNLQKQIDKRNQKKITLDSNSENNFKNLRDEFLRIN